MKRDPEHVYAYFLAELGTTGSMDGNKRFIMKGMHRSDKIQTLLNKYIGKEAFSHHPQRNT